MNHPTAGLTECSRARYVVLAAFARAGRMRRDVLSAVAVPASVSVGRRGGRKVVGVLAIGPDTTWPTRRCAITVALPTAEGAGLKWGVRASFAEGAPRPGCL